MMAVSWTVPLTISHYILGSPQIQRLIPKVISLEVVISKLYFIWKFF